MVLRLNISSPVPNTSLPEVFKYVGLTKTTESTVIKALGVINLTLKPQNSK